MTTTKSPDNKVLTKLERLKRIVERHQYDEFDYPDCADRFEDPANPVIAVDAVSANAMLTVYNALKPEHQAKFARMLETPWGLRKLVDFTWKHVR